MSEESVNLTHYFPYDVKLRLLAHSRSFLANQKATNAIVGAENLLMVFSQSNVNSHGHRFKKITFGNVMGCKSINQRLTSLLNTTY